MVEIKLVLHDTLRSPGDRILYLAGPDTDGDYLVALQLGRSNRRRMFLRRESLLQLRHALNVLLMDDNHAQT